MATLSVALIVKNEEQFIDKVIQNVLPVADEIVITDTGSTDNTIDIVKKFKPRLFHFKWNGNESEARNFTISKCKSDWILFIDADEFIDIGSYDRMRKLISGRNKFIAYRVIIRLYFSPHIKMENIFKQNYRGYYDIYSVIRLFKARENIFYSRPIYTSVKDSLRDRIDKVGSADILLHHLDILRNKRKRAEKVKWYDRDPVYNFKKFPNSPEVSYSLAHYYRLNGELKKAVKFYKKSLKLNPEYVKSKLSLGLIYVIVGKEEKGLRLIKECRKNKNIFPWELKSHLNDAYNIIAERTVNDLKK